VIMEGCAGRVGAGAGTIHRRGHTKRPLVRDHRRRQAKLRPGWSHTVGFWGLKILARTDRDLSALSASSDLGGEFDQDDTLANGWRIATVHRADGGDDVLAAFVAEVHAPVLIAEVADSDFAAVGFASPGRSIAHFVLNPRGARGYDYPVDPAEQDAASAALVDWAGEPADLAEVAKAIDGNMVYAEDSFIRLAGALGAFPASELEDRIFGPMPEDG
jgi:hypothetical protein